MRSAGKPSEGAAIGASTAGALSATVVATWAAKVTESAIKA